MKKALLCLTLLTLLSCKDQTKAPASIDKNNQEQELNVQTTTKDILYDDKKITISLSQDKTSIEIASQGFTKANTTFTHDLLGYNLVSSELQQIENQSSPVLFLTLVSPGSGSYSGILAYSLNDGQQLTSITYNSELTDPKINQGYMGHDSFSIKDGYLMRTFPLYDERDTNAHPSLGHREISYQLIDNGQNKSFEISHIEDIQ